MNVVLIGSGNVATVFGKLIKKSGHSIVQVIGRNEQHAKALADILGSDFHTNLSQANIEADIYVISVSDSSIIDIANNFKTGNKIVVHTSGAVSKNVLQKCSANFGVLYPLQSLRKQNENTLVIPLLIDANNEETLDTLRSFAETISSKVSVADDQQRLKLHVAAVIVSNFSNYIFTLTKAYCEKENIPFNMLLPLIQETAMRLNEFAPEDVQTGPAIRGDKPTMQKHLELLKEYPELKKIYEIISEGIINYYK
jgi:predicted short-subunit dehydrogenase-like oxidoreductase (DUF2520 family)